MPLSGERNYNGGELMRVSKYLIFLFAITLITSSANVFALKDFKNFYTISNASIPAFNGSKTYYKSGIDLQDAGYTGQGMEEVSISPSGDTLDVILKRTKPGVTASSGWKILENGKDTKLAEGITWGFPTDEYQYELTIDSRWYYTKSTSLSAKWGFYNN